MPEEKRLIATIIPKIDQTALSNAVRQAFQEAFTANINVSGSGVGGGGGGGGSGSGGNVSSAVGNASRQAGSGSGNGVSGDLVAEAASAELEHQLHQGADASSDTERRTKSMLGVLSKMLTGSQDVEDASERKRAAQMQIISAGVSKVSGFGMSVLQGTFGVLEDIYGRLKSASPLLQTIESLFNLAMTLFFMPIGNKLAEVILPATLELVDAVVDMWDKFDGKTLPDMIEYAITEGVQIIGDYFINIGESLQGGNDLLNAIGNLLTNIGEFIKNDAVSVLTSLLNVMTFVLEHIKEIVAILIAMYTMNAALQILQLYATAVSGSLAGMFGAGLAVAGLASAVAGGIGYGTMGVMGFAEGGYVPATPGGVPAIIGEGGEGEYVIPESKMQSVGTTNNYITINGYTSDDVIRLIRDEVSSQISLSRLKGGF